MIKQKLLIGLFCAGVAGLFSGCSSDTSDMETDDWVTLTFTAGTGGADTRASVVEETLDGGTYKARWDKGDVINIYTGTSLDDLRKCDFTTAEGGISSAQFTYIGPKVETRTYFGLYAAERTGKQTFAYTIPTDGSIRQEKPGDTRFLSPYRPMYTDVIEREESSDELTGLQFHHLSALLVFNITNQGNKVANVKSVTIRTADGKEPFYSEGVYSTITVPSAEQDIRVAGFSDRATLTLGQHAEGFDIKPGETAATYLATNVVKFEKAQKIVIEVDMDGTTVQTLAMEAKGDFLAGKYYRFGLAITPESKLEVEAGIAGWEDGGTIVVPNN